MEKRIKDRLNELKSLKSEHMVPKLTKTKDPSYLYELSIRIDELKKLLQ